MQGPLAHDGNGLFENEQVVNEEVHHHRECGVAHVEQATVFTVGFAEFVNTHVETGSGFHNSQVRDSQKEHSNTLSKVGHDTWQHILGVP